MLIHTGKKTHINVMKMVNLLEFPFVCEFANSLKFCSVNSVIEKEEGQIVLCCHYNAQYNKTSEITPCYNIAVLIVSMLCMCR